MTGEVRTNIPICLVVSISENQRVLRTLNQTAPPLLWQIWPILPLLPLGEVSTPLKEERKSATMFSGPAWYVALRLEKWGEVHMRSCCATRNNWVDLVPPWQLTWLTAGLLLDNKPHACQAGTCWASRDASDKGRTGQRDSFSLSVIRRQEVFGVDGNSAKLQPSPYF